MSEAPETEDVKAAAPQETLEDEARRSGWTPKDQFKGDPEKWIDAETFVQRGREILPIVQAQNRKLEKAVDDANAKVKSLEKTLSKFAEHNSKTEQRAYERAMKDLKAELATAAAAGDLDEVERITDDMADLKQEARPKDEPPAGVKEAVKAFEAANPWFGTDKVMTAAARAIGQELAESGVTDPEEQLTEVARRIKVEFPHKFTNPRREAAATVEGAPAPLRQASKSYADLPADAKAMCDQFVKDIPGFTREKYVKDYFIDR